MKKKKLNEYQVKCVECTQMHNVFHMCWLSVCIFLLTVEAEKKRKILTSCTQTQHGSVTITNTGGRMLSERTIFECKKQKKKNCRSEQPAAAKHKNKR